MFNQQYSMDQSNSQHSSQQSQTFLTVPRLIQGEVQAYQVGVQKHVNFEDPNQLQKSEHKESLEEGEFLGSRMSLEKREYNKVDEVEENYKSLKLFQIEMQNINGRKLISKNSRKFSDQSDFGLRKQSEQMRKASSSYSPQPSPKFKVQASPLLEKLELVVPTKWPKRWFFIVKFLSKIMSVSPNILKKEHLMLIDDKANIISKKCILFNPYSPIILWIRYCFMICIMAGLLIVLWEMAFRDSKVLLIAFFGFTLIESASNYFIGVYLDEMYTEDIWKISKQYIIYDIIIVITFLLALFVSDYFGIQFQYQYCYLYLDYRDCTLQMKKRHYVIYQYWLFIQSQLYSLKSHWTSKIASIIRFADDYTTIYIMSLQWTVYQLTNSTNMQEFETSIPQRLLSIFTTLLGYSITIYLIKYFWKDNPRYPISAQLNEDLTRYLNRTKLKPLDLTHLRPDLQKSIREEVYLPHLSQLPFSQNFLKMLCQRLQSATFPNGTQLQQQNQVMDKLIILIKGNVAECVGSKILTQNHIPVQYFYRQTLYPLEIRCISETLIAFVDMQDFLALIKMHSMDFQKFCMLRDCTKEKCPCCGYRGHPFKRCKHVFYVPNYKELILVHNTSEPNDRISYYRDNGRNRINAMLNKNLVCLTAISFAISNKISNETELTNEVMGKLQGSTNNFEDSILNDFQDERSSRYSLYQKHGTVEVPKTINSPQNTFSSQTHQQSSMPPIKLEERESSYNSRKFVHKHLDHTHTQNSIKVNLVKSNNSTTDFQVKRTPKNKQTSSSSSLNKKIQSTSIMQQPKSQTGSIIPQQEEQDDQMDQVCNYEYYYPAYNIENIANGLNQNMSRSMSFVK